MHCRSYLVFCVCLEVVCLKTSIVLSKKKIQRRARASIQENIYLKLQSSHNNLRRDVKPSAFKSV